MQKEALFTLGNFEVYYPFMEVKNVGKGKGGWPSKNPGKPSGGGRDNNPP